MLTLNPKPEVDLRLDGRHLEKLTWCYNSAGDGSIWMKLLGWYKWILRWR